MKKHFILVIILAVTVITILIPVLRMTSVVSPNWQGVWPELTDDSIYYYSRIHEIKDGYPFLGNPYFFEHRGEIAVSFFSADWLASLPLLAGASLTATIILNLIVWTLVLNLSMYTLLIQLEFSKTTAVVGSLLTYFSVYSLQFRPVAMQIVFPFFTIFLLSYILWLKKPYDKLRMMFFAMSTGATYYIYSYLILITTITLLLTLITLLIFKKIRIFKYLILIGLMILLVASPVLLYTLKQFQIPNFLETMRRIGLVSSNLPTVSAFQYGLVILPLILLWIIIGKKSVNAFFYLIIGTSLLLAIFSNVVTGKELETANHIGRLVSFWIIPASFGILLASKKIFKCLAIFILILTMKQNMPSTLALLFPPDTKYYIKIQDYADPLEWLDKYESNTTVIWAIGDINQYIPVMTKHYVLFHPLGGLHFMSSGELEERYLVYNYMQNLSLANIEQDFRQYAGTGNAIHQYSFYNYGVRICRLFHFYTIINDCGEIATPISFKGEKYFVNLYENYLNKIKPAILELLQKYHVKYLLSHEPISSSLMINLGKPSLIYNQEGYYIYKFTFEPIFEESNQQYSQTNH